MSSYSISPKLKSNRVFILQKSELEKRFDPSWYVYLKSIQGFKHKKVAFKNLLLDNPQYGANEIGIERETNTEPRYIRITDINDFGELENELGKTASVIEEKYFLKENDLLLARSGNTVGKSYLHKDVGYDCFFAGYMIRFKIDISKVIPQYIFAYTQTDFYRKWIKAVQRTTGQPNINAEEYRSLEILLPDTLVQEKIVNIYFGFLSQKKQNEAEAEKLLTSIDDYLLKELGIILPTPPENTLKNRIFIVPVSQLSGNRLDVNYYNPQVLSLVNVIKSAKYSTQLKKIYSSISTGFNNETRFIEEGIKFLRTQNIRPVELDVENTLFTKDESVRITSIGDLLFTRIGVGVGDVSYNDKGDFAISDNVICLKLKDNKIGKFISLFLNTELGKVLLNREKRDTARAIISYENILNLPIPVPPLDKQKDIAKHITDIRQQAKQLKDKTKEALKKASDEIEKILLD